VANTQGVRAAALAIVGVLALAGCGGGGTKTVTVTQTQTVTHVRTVTAPPATTTTPPAAASECTGSDMQGSFAVVEGSAGAGQISYRLTVTNKSSTPCWVSGVPAAQLLGTTGNPLPTHVSSAQAGAALAAEISLQQGESATADARFSPDVTGVGDHTSGPCEPTATVLRVTLAGPSSFDAPVQPPTPVCEQGSLGFTFFTAHAP
jgi:hypothetical protein